MLLQTKGSPARPLPRLLVRPAAALAAPFAHTQNALTASRVSKLTVTLSQTLSTLDGTRLVRRRLLWRALWRAVTATGYG